MKKNKKGFTLIELLVVVAIIGILASVGVVAYSGYTASAKENAAKSNHGSIVKYLQAEITKCSLGSQDDVFLAQTSYTGSTTCADITTKAATAATAAASPISITFTNPYDAGVSAIVTTAPTQGQTRIELVATTLTITTLTKTGETALTADVLVE